MFVSRDSALCSCASNEDFVCNTSSIPEPLCSITMRALFLGSDKFSAYLTPKNTFALLLLVVNRFVQRVVHPQGTQMQMANPVPDNLVSLHSQEREPIANKLSCQ